jgi:hypothetical protein
VDSGVRRRRRGEAERTRDTLTPAFCRVFRKSLGGENGPSVPSPGERSFVMLPLLLILLLLAIVLGGFFVFTLKVAVIVAIVLLLVGLFGGYGYRGRRTV